MQPRPTTSLWKSTLASPVLSILIAVAVGLPQAAYADGEQPPASDSEQAQPAPSDGADGEAAPAEGEPQSEPPEAAPQPPQPPAPPQPPQARPPQPPTPRPPQPQPANVVQPPRPPRPPAPGVTPPKAGDPAKPGVQPASKTTQQPAAGGAKPQGGTTEPKKTGEAAKPAPAPKDPAKKDEKKAVAGSTEKKPAAKTRVKVNRFRFTGNQVIPTGELELLVKGEVGKEHDLESLRQVAEVVTAKYQEKGYAVAKAFVPAQDIRDGIVEIACVEGKVGKINVVGATHYDAAFIQERIEAAAPQGVLDNKGLEKSLLLLNECPHLKVSAKLKQGTAPGTVDVECTAEEHFPLSVTLDYNNFGNDGTGHSRFGAQVDWSNAAVCGDLFTVRGVVGDEGDNYDYFRGSYVAPIGCDGMKAGIFGYWGTFDVDQTFRELDVNGESAGGGAYVAKPFIKERLTSLSGEFGFEIRDTELMMLGEVSSDDEIRTVHLGVNYDGACLEGRNFVSFYYYQGLGEFLGGLGEDDERASRLDADNSFARFNPSLTRVQYVMDCLSAVFRFQGQVAVDSLVASEQMQIGGADSVRGFQSGEQSGDDGYFLSLEPRLTICREHWYVPQLVAFIDHAGAHRKRPLIGQDSWEHLTGMGVGLRVAAPHDVDVRFDVAWPVAPSGSSGDEPAFYVAGSVKF